MKLYFHPVSTVSRPIMLLAADSGIQLEYEVVDLFKGAHLEPAFASVNPSAQVPVLVDGDFRLTESSAILKYLADKVGAPTYPKDPQQRARVHERMDWFNTGFYRDVGYGMVYSQCLPGYKRDDPAVQAANIAWSRERARKWLNVLDQHILGAGNKFLCGADVTIADYFGIAMATVGEVVKLDYSRWSNVSRWIAAMKARPTWGPVNEGFYQYFVGGFKDGTYEGL